MVHSLHYDNHRIRFAALSWRKSAFASFVSQIFRVPGVNSRGARVISFYALSLKIFPESSENRLRRRWLSDFLL